MVDSDLNGRMKLYIFEASGGDSVGESYLKDEIALALTYVIKVM